VKNEFGGDLASAVKERLRGGNELEGKGLRAVKKVLQEFCTIGEPSAEKILLFAGIVPVAAVPSACVAVPIRLFVGQEGKGYAADYRVAREILAGGLPDNFKSRQRAYLLLKRHGQEICKRSAPKCEICPVTAECAYLQRKASD
jgi:endonuclease III